MKSFEEAAEEFSKHSDMFKQGYRNVASRKLSLSYAGSGQGIGSSDVSIKAIELYRETNGDIRELLEIDEEITRACESMLGY
jgi:hypothetical protein